MLGRREEKRRKDRIDHELAGNLERGVTRSAALCAQREEGPGGAMPLRRDGMTESTIGIYRDLRPGG